MHKWWSKQMDVIASVFGYESVYLLCCIVCLCMREEVPISSDV